MTFPIAIRYVLDGEPQAADVSPARTLAALLGQHAGCGEGICGSCTILVDGVAVRSCLMLAAQADGTTIETVASLSTIEGSPGGALTPLQRAFTTHGAFQCGWCLAGTLVGTAAYMRDHGEADRDDLKAHFTGHICRCLGGARLVDATLASMAETLP